MHAIVILRFNATLANFCERFLALICIIKCDSNLALLFYTILFYNYLQIHAHLFLCFFEGMGLDDKRLRISVSGNGLGLGVGLRISG